MRDFNNVPPSQGRRSYFGEAAPRTPRMTHQEEAMERYLFQWYVVRSMSSAGPIPVPEIRRKASEINTVCGGPADLEEPTGWLTRFLGLLGIERPVPAEEEYGPDNTYYLFEGSVQSRRPPWRGGADAKTHRLRVGVCVNASGTHMMPLIVVGKAAHPRCFASRFEIDELPVVYRGHRDTAITQDTCREYFRTVFIPEVDRRQANAARPVKVLLVVPDKAASQASSEDQTNGRYTLRLLPASAALPAPADDQLQRRAFAALTQLYLENVTRHREGRYNGNVSAKEACLLLSDAWRRVRTAPATASTPARHHPQHAPRDAAPAVDLIVLP